MSRTDADINYLLSARAVRERAHQILAAGEQGNLAHWLVAATKLPAVVEYVCDLTKAQYPDLKVPFHSRWRHLEVGTALLWQPLREEVGTDWGRTSIELIILSVLLDAGAGPDWQYQTAKGSQVARSEGLALASFDLYCGGGFHQDRRAENRHATAAGLQSFQADHLRAGFQVTSENPLVGVAGRTALIQELGRVVAEDPVFKRDGVARLGHFFDFLCDQAKDGKIQASDVLKQVLLHLGPIWPSRLTVGNQPLGDVWPHPLAKGPGQTNGLVPFHKLSQWLTYSLLDALIMNDLKVGGVTELTGLPEYRNGGLLIDFGVVTPRSPQLLEKQLAAGDEEIVEWRALTVALLDQIGAAAQKKFGKTPDELPLACILQGGTWTAGRKIAAEIRPGGVPPLNIASDGTVF